MGVNAIWRKRVHRAIYVRNLQIDGFCAVRIYWRICVFCANARPRTLGTLPDDASRLMRGVPTQRLVGLWPPPCVVPPRKPIGFRQRTETRKPPTRHTKTPARALATASRLGLRPRPTRRFARAHLAGFTNNLLQSHALSINTLI